MELAWNWRVVCDGNGREDASHHLEANAFHLRFINVCTLRYFKTGRMLLAPQVLFPRNTIPTFSRDVCLIHDDGRTYFPGPCRLCSFVCTSLGRLAALCTPSDGRHQAWVCTFVAIFVEVMVIVGILAFLPQSFSAGESCRIIRVIIRDWSHHHHCRFKTCDASFRAGLHFGLMSTSFLRVTRNGQRSRDCHLLVTCLDDAVSCSHVGTRPSSGLRVSQRVSCATCLQHLRVHQRRQSPAC